MPAGGKRRRSVKHSDVVEPQKSPLENVHALGIFAVHPPSEIQQQLVKNLFEKSAIRDAAQSPLNFINPKGSPRVDRRIHGAKRPLIRGQLSIRSDGPLPPE